MNAVTTLGIVEARRGYITVAADTEAQTRTLADQVARHTTPGHVHIHHLDTVIQETARPISTQYLHNIKDPFQAANWHLWKGTHPHGKSVVDWYTFLYPESRRRITNQLIDTVCHHDAANQVTDREDLPSLFETVFPVLAGHGLTYLIADQVWHWLKQEKPGQLQLREKQIETNREAGRSFEAFFEQLCTDNGLYATPYSTEKLREHYPGIAATLEENQGNLHGMPDFFVDKGSHTTHRGGVWAPDNRYAFVEVKYNQSPLTAEQETMLKQLASRGVETWLFQGTEEHYRFHRVAPDQHQMRVLPS